MEALPPIPNEFTHVIASREFELVGPVGSARLTVEIGAPVQDVPSVGGTDWRCPILYLRDAHVEVVSMCGIDSFQALQVAIAVVGQRLEAISNESGQSIRFLDSPYNCVTHLPDHPSTPRSGT